LSDGESIPFIANERIGTTEQPRKSFGPQREITTVLVGFSPGLPNNIPEAIRIASNGNFACGLLKFARSVLRVCE